MPVRLRHQTRSLIFTSTAGLVLVAVLLIAGFLPVRFSRMEERITEEAFESSLASARNAIMAQERLNSDWAWWDASYRFLTEGDKNYLKEHIPPEILWENRLYFAAIIDQNNSVRWGAMLGNNAPMLLPLTEEQKTIIQIATQQNSVPEGGILSGYTTMSGDITVALTVCRVLKNNKTGPTVGWFVLASRPDSRWFGPSGQIKLTSKSNGSLRPLTIFAGNTVISRELPSLKFLEPTILTMTRPAAIIEEGDRILHLSVLALILSGTMIGLMTYSWLTRNFINRIEFLKRQINVETPTPLRDSVDDEIGELCRAFNDLLDALKRQGEIHRLESLQDPLTGLANRRMLFNKLHESLSSAKRSGGRVALIMIDLDGFKGVNDSLGHSVGDALLKQVGDRFSSLAGENYTIARIGGDEFSMVVEDVYDDEAMVICRRIRGVLLQPFHVGSSSLQISASLGLALFPKDGQDGADLFDAADAAMYRAKRTGSGLERYEPSLDGLDPLSERIDTEIKEALDNGLMEPRYDREIYLYNKRDIRSYLIRPGCAGIDPLDLLSRSRTNGTAAAIDLMILRKALRDGQKRPLSLDLSVWHVWNEGLPLALSGIIRDEDFDPHQLELSFDIRCLEEHRDRCVMMMMRLKSCGVSLSLREFGRHYVPFETVRSLGLSSVKIPRDALVKAEDNSSEYLVSAMLKLASDLGLETVLTGVNSIEQVKKAEYMGFSAVQLQDRLDSTLADDIVNK